jgi:hypothetical protein
MATAGAMEELYKTIAEGLEFLHEQSETYDAGEARVLFFALASFLDDRGIIDHLKAAVQWMKQDENLGDACLGDVIH